MSDFISPGEAPHRETDALYTQTGGEGHTAVAIEILMDLEREQAQQQPHRTSPPTIHRVRPTIKNWQLDSPRVVSLGPLHHGKDDLRKMEKLKCRFLNNLLGRSPHNSVNKYVDAVRRCAPRARAEYSENIDLSDEKFMEMMVLDGCFLLECLLRNKEEGTGLRSALASANCDTTLLRHDCLLMENQIPFCVVKALFEATTTPDLFPAFDKDLALTTLAAQFLKIKNPPSELRNAHHLLDLFHSSLKPNPSPHPDPITRSRVVTHLLDMVLLMFYGVLYFILTCKRSRPKPLLTPRMIPSATELQEAGITIKKIDFDKNTEPMHKFLRISFRDGRLEIPFLSVGKSTESNFRNLIAYEQCYPTAGNYFTSYVNLMDKAVNTAADVAVLRSCGIMESTLGSDGEVAQMFNRICRGAKHFDYENHYLAPVFKDVKTYCEERRHRWRAQLMRDHFNSPWAVISVIVASALLIFTAVQTVCSVRGNI